MEIVKISNVSSQEVSEKIKAGKTLVYPTETCYGLGCDATNRKAVQKIFAIKKRQSEKSVLVLMPDMATLSQYVEITPLLMDLANKYWPGPLTVVSHLKDVNSLPDGVVAVDGTIGFRITDHNFVTDLFAYLDTPLVSTSANISSLASPYDIEDVIAMYKNAPVQPDMVIDAGVLPHHSPSTIIKLENEQIEVLRQGELIVK